MGAAPEDFVDRDSSDRRDVRDPDSWVDRPEVAADSLHLDWEPVNPHALNDCEPELPFAVCVFFVVSVGFVV